MRVMMMVDAEKTEGKTEAAAQRESRGVMRPLKLSIYLNPREYALLCALFERLSEEGYVTLSGLFKREAMENIRRKQEANVYPTFTREQLQKALERRLQLRRMMRTWLEEEWG